MTLTISADVFGPPRPRIRAATEALGHRPRSRQRVIDHGDPVMQQIRVCRVEIKVFLNDALIILVQRNAASIVNAGTFETAGFDFEHAVMAGTVLVDPFSDGISVE